MVTGPLRAVLTVAQIACAVLLVIAAGLLVRSLWSLSRSDSGFRRDQVVTARISPTESLCNTTERCLAFYRELDDKAQSASGVSGAALVNTFPLTGAVAKRSLEIEGFVVPPSKAAPLFWLHVVTSGYFPVMDIRVESGRAFVREDFNGPPVAVVSSTTARRFWETRTQSAGAYVSSARTIGTRSSASRPMSGPLISQRQCQIGSSALCMCRMGLTGRWRTDGFPRR